MFKFFLPCRKINNLKFYNFINRSVFETSITLKKFKDQYIEFSNPEENVTNFTEKIAGRILSIRKMSKELIFADLHSNCDDLQIVFNSKYINKSIVDKIKRGYIVGLEGAPFRTKSGQLSMLAKEVSILAECSVDFPIMNRKDKEMLIDYETRYSKRYLDLIVNSSHKDYFFFRAKMIKFIRNYLDEMNFLEVETPILSHKAGGALAKPFVTHSNAIKSDLYLRVAPELFLKQLIIAGYEKVYEIGKNFRNEDISVRHNPEFTSIEFYESYSNYMKLLDFTKKFLKSLVNELLSSKQDHETEINKKIISYFDEENYKIYDVISELEKFFNKKIIFDNTKENFYQQINNFYLDYINLKRENESINNSPQLNLKKKLDFLIENIIEPKCKDSPSFIINHPTILSPLAKSHIENKFLSERFELFLNGIEVINSYSELNDPFEQKERFIEQKKLNSFNCEHNGSQVIIKDEEIHPFDNEFIEALSHGMPPTAGWGLGIDRLCMILLNLSNIKEVILFPLMNVKKS